MGVSNRGRSLKNNQMKYEESNPDTSLADLGDHVIVDLVGVIAIRYLCPVVALGDKIKSLLCLIIDTIGSIFSSFLLSILYRIYVPTNVHSVFTVWHNQLELLPLGDQQ